MAVLNVRNSKKRGENNFSGGINQGLDPFGIAENQSVDEVGFDTDDYPYLSTAKAHTSYGATGGAQTNLLTSFGNTHMLRSVGTKIQWDNSGTWTDIAGTFTNADWDGTNFEVSGAAALILVNGTDAPRFWNGSTLGTLGGSPPAANFITNDTIRVWMAKGDNIYYCAYLDAQDWSSAENSGELQYFTERGGDITGFKNFYGDKYIWKRDSMAVIQGTNYFNYRLKEISNDVGCVSAKTIQEVGDTLMWLGDGDIYLFQGGFPVPIGEPVRGYLDRINTTHLNKCCAFHDGNRYYLNLVIDSATEPNIRLVYDTRYKVWRVPGQNENFRYGYRFKNQTYAGNSSGQTYKINAAATTGSWSVTTKPFDESIPEAEKEYKELHLQGYFPTGTTLSLSYSVDDRGTSFTVINYDPTSTSDVVQNKNCIIPLDTTPLTHWMRFKLTGTGPAIIYNQQRYYKVCRVQH
jgi:hypothetical protein